MGGATDVCPKPQAQACYYVAPSGSDTGDGSVTAPFQTITKARDVVRTINSNMTGDIYVYLRGGDHRITKPITFEVKDSGWQGNPARNTEAPHRGPGSAHWPELWRLRAGGEVAD